MVAVNQQSEDENYTEQEMQRRFERLVHAALNTRPKPLKSMSPKGVAAQSKKGRAKPSARGQRE